MSGASDFRTAARSATIRQVIGQSGSTYIIFWFPDGSVCAAKKLASEDRASAQLEFVATKPCLNDCGVSDYEGTTYQKGTELLRRLRGG